jgi:inward rectifier potassium channel
MRARDAMPPAYTTAKIGLARFDLRDPYHLAVRISWPQFMALFLALNLAANVVFAGLYLIGPGSIANARPGSFSDAFFFSFETLATVGYGAMSPATLYGHLISTVEIICGMAFTAILTGLVFVRFSRPKAKVVYADRVVITNYNGKPTLMIRIGNGRPGPLSDAVARVTALLVERTLEGQSYRHTHDLHLRMNRLPMFALTWTIMHTIDEHSPLFGIDPAWIEERRLILFLNLEARDPALAASVHDVHQYGGNDIARGQRYADAVSTDAAGRTVADLSLISALVPE